MRVQVTIPCFDEEARLDVAQVERLLDDERIEVLFVDDGSRDGTRALLAKIASEHEGRASLLALDRNGGKAEAVRAGMRESLARGADVVGYLDADFATPPEEMSHLVDELVSTGKRVVMGARLARLGAQIDRKPTRHYLGRVFATVASLVLDLDVYDTQCGAKLFRDGPALRHALEEPFSSRWAFDVELLGRLLAGVDGEHRVGASEILEVPLDRWEDVRGSKMSGAAAVRAGTDLLKLGMRKRLVGEKAFFGK